MTKKMMRIAACICAGAMMITSPGLETFAATASTESQTTQTASGSTTGTTTEATTTAATTAAAATATVTTASDTTDSVAQTTDPTAQTATETVTTETATAATTGATASTATESTAVQSQTADTEEQHATGYVTLPDEPKAQTAATDTDDSSGTSIAGLRLFATSQSDASYYKSAYVTSVKNQGGYGCCWAFSSLGSGESNLLKKSLMTSPDLSELQLAYYAFHSVEDPLGGTTGDSITYSGSNYLNEGNNYWIAGDVLATWAGATSETTVPYTTASTVLSSGLTSGYAYSKDVAHIDGFYALEGNDRSAVKKAIVEYGAVSTSYYAGSAYYNSTTYGQYCGNSSVSANHAVEVVGWDDTYSADNFKTKPAGDGAWIVKNSWGSYWGDSGYFYLSYYDQTVGDFMAFSFNTSDNYDHNYQYDGCPYLTQVGGDENVYGSQTAANIFTAHANSDGSELLKGASFFVMDGVGATYTVQAYRNLTNTANPYSGELCAAASGTVNAVGYYTTAFSEPVALTEGESFAIVVTLSSSDTTLDLQLGAEQSMNFSAINSNYVASASAGQSLIFLNNIWDDYGQCYKANIKIKAFTDDVAASYTYATSISLDSTAATVYADDTRQLTATVLPSDADDKDVIWTSGNTAVATVSSSGLVTAVAPGTAVIQATTADGTNLSASCTITVKRQASSISLNSTAATLYTAETKQLTATVLPSDTTNSAVTWTSSNTAAATVSSSGLVTAVAPGTAVIQATTADGTNLSASCTITVKQRNVTSISLSSTTAAIYDDETTQLTATVLPSNATNRAVTWTSSNTAVATVSSSGLVTAVAAGTAVIKATTKDGTGLSASCTVTVKSTTVYQGVDYSAVYNRKYYYAKYADLQSALGNDAAALLQHFVTSGMSEGRQGKSTFVVQYYENNYVDLYHAFGSDLKAYYLHYISNGRKEGRNAASYFNTTVYHGVDYSKVYNYAYYAANNADLKAAFGTEALSYIQHFVNSGMKEGRVARADFDPLLYKYLYADLRNAFGSDTVQYYLHYMQFGYKEGRTGATSAIDGQDYSLVYNRQYYENKYPDLKQAFGDNGYLYLQHFLQNGMKESRQAISSFNVTVYRNTYQDLRNAFGTDMKSYYLHYITYGYKEGRKAS